jgi:glutamate/aspartate transport system substrate-binding protein
MKQPQLPLAMLGCLLIVYAIQATVQAQEPTGTLDKIKAANTITLGHRESSIPFSYYDDQQQVIGYSQEIALRVVDAVKHELGRPDLKVRLNPVTSQNRLPLVQNGTVDLECGSTTNNAERQRQVAFSNSIFIVGTRLLTRKGSGIQGVADLAGKTLVTTAGTTSERLARKLNEDRTLGMRIIAAKDHGESFLMLETGRAAAFMMDDALLYGELAKARRPDEWVVVGEPQSLEAYGCLLRKDDPAFKRLVDATIAGLQTSGEARRIYAKWFESPIPPKGLNLNFPLSPAMVELFANPNDRALQ